MILSMKIHWRYIYLELKNDFLQIFQVELLSVLALKFQNKIWRKKLL